jgi:protoporphyrinogen IX oxidase
MCDSKKVSRPSLTGAFFWAFLGFSGLFLPWRCSLGEWQSLAYTCRMLWVKAFHIIFVASWFAGLFYLPRIFVNLAQVQADLANNAPGERLRLLLMARKLLRFTTLLAVPALGLGLWLWLGYGIGKGPGNGWMHVKLAVVVLAVGYHHACGLLLRKFELDTNQRSHVWYRWFNEVPVLLLSAAVILVVVKPF